MGVSKSVTVRMKIEDIASLNQRLAQSGFDTLGEMVRAYTQGIILYNQLVESFAETRQDCCQNVNKESSYSGASIA